MKIVHIITGLGLGGAEAVLHRLINVDQEREHIVISLSDEGAHGPVLTSEGVRVIPLYMRRGRVSFATLLRLYRVLKSLSPDVVQTWMYHADLLGGIIARIAGYRAVIWSLRNSDIHPSRVSWSTRMVVHACAFLSGFVPQKIISCAKSSMKTHQAIGYAADKFVLIPNGYDVSAFDVNAMERDSFRMELGIRDDCDLLGMVGRWDPQKDHRGLLLSFSKVLDCSPNTKLVLVGKGCDSSNHVLMMMIKDFGLSESVIPLGARTDIRRVMNGLDIHVLSSAGEAFPNVVAEAMACGTPCVVTDVGDAVEIIGDYGWSALSLNPESLANAILSALSAMGDADLWNERKMRCRQRIVETYSLAEMLNRYIAVWDEVSLKSKS
jgi:glycosyltransferase involved in cell wall biosynthesis